MWTFHVLYNTQFKVYSNVFGITELCNQTFNLRLRLFLCCVYPLPYQPGPVPMCGSVLAACLTLFTHVCHPGLVCELEPDFLFLV